jgi:hypothetical protein
MVVAIGVDLNGDRKVVRLGWVTELPLSLLLELDVRLDAPGCFLMLASSSGDP